MSNSVVERGHYLVGCRSTWIATDSEMRSLKCTGGENEATARGRYKAVQATLAHLSFSSPSLPLSSRMSFSLDFNGSTPLQLPPEALNAAAPLRGCALMQTANAHDRLLMLALYLKQQASLREVLVRTFPLRETRWSSPGKPRASSKRVLSGVNAAVVVRSQEAQEIREWILGLSEPVAGSLCVPLYPPSAARFRRLTGAHCHPLADRKSVV